MPAPYLVLRERQDSPCYLYDGSVRLSITRKEPVLLTFTSRLHQPCPEGTVSITPKLMARPIFTSMATVESFQRALSGRRLSSYRPGLIQQSLQQAITLIQKHG